MIYKIGNVHGHTEFIALDGEDQEYIIERDKKGKPILIPTIMEKSRLKKFKPITITELILRLKERKL